MKHFLSLQFILLLLLSACKNEPETITFSGITERNEHCEIIAEDASDWKLFENWSETESALFTQNYTTSCTSEVYSLIVCPNPCVDAFHIYLSKPQDVRFAYRIVDENFNVIVSEDSVYTTHLAISMSYFNVTNKTVRMYYKFFGEDCQNNGHGDIKVN